MLVDFSLHWKVLQDSKMYGSDLYFKVVFSNKMYSFLYATICKN